MKHNLFKENVNGEGGKVTSSSCEKTDKIACKMLVLDIKLTRRWR
mgnify:CR=1 FL=1